MKIAAIELIELQNIPVTPPVFKKPLRTGVRVVKVKTDYGLVGLSQLGGSCTRRVQLSCVKNLHPGSR